MYVANLCRKAPLYYIHDCTLILSCVVYLWFFNSTTPRRVRRVKSSKTSDGSGTSTPTTPKRSVSVQHKQPVLLSTNDISSILSLCDDSPRGSSPAVSRLRAPPPGSGQNSASSSLPSSKRGGPFISSLFVHVYTYSVFAYSFARTWTDLKH